MKYQIFNRIILVLLPVAFFAGCKKWDKHNENLDPDVTQTLLERMEGKENVSRFLELLKKSGADKEINSRTYTVYAPTNQALTALDPALEADSAQLRRFVLNHIAVQTYVAAKLAGEQRIPMMNGKFHNIHSLKIDEANIVEADLLAKNGVLQVVDKILPYLNNSWDFIESDQQMPALNKAYLMNSYYKVFDSAKAVQIGVDTLGRPVYQPGTDSVTSNIFWNTVYDIRDESRLFTSFVLTDAAWVAENIRLQPYYTDSLNRSYASANMIQEYAVEGAYDAAHLPDTLISRYGVKIGIDKNAIVKTVKTSNGYIHVMSKMTVRVQDKFKPIIVEAENFTSSSHNRLANTYKRSKMDSATGRRFIDIVVFNHGVPLFNYGYTIRNVPGKQKYRAYWVAVNDSINGMTAPFQQKLGIDTATSVKFFGYVTVPFNEYREQLIGELTLPQYRPRMNIYLTASSANNAVANALVCDYIKLVPVF